MASILKLMNELDYKPNPTGVCHGLCMMAERARVFGEYDKFAARMAYLDKLQEGQIVKLLNEAIDHSIALRDGETSEPLTEEEKILLTLDSFFFGISSYYNPRTLQNFLRTTGSTLNQSTSDVAKVEELIYGPGIDMTRIAPVGDYCLSTTEKDEHQLLKSFLMVVKESDIKCGLVIKLFDHAVHLFYENGQWFCTSHAEKGGLTHHPSIENLLVTLMPELAQNGIANVNISVFINDQQSTLEHYNKAKKELLDNLKDISSASLVDLYKDDINRRDQHGSTLLYIAAQTGNLETVKKLLDEKPNVNLETQQGATPLYIAAQNGFTTIADLLVNKGASLEQITNVGATAFYAAAQNGHADVLQLFLQNINNEQKKMDVINQKSADGSAPLYMAVQNGHIQAVEILLNNKADIQKATADGCTVIWAAASNGYSEIIELILREVADPQEKTKLVNQVSNEGSSPLYRAAKNGYTKAAEILLKNNADINKTSSSGATALWIAAYYGHGEMIDLLLQHVPDAQKKLALVNQTANQEFSPLHAATSQGHIHVVERLLLQKADIYRTAANGTTALTTAIKKGYTNILKLFLNNQEQKIDVNDKIQDTTLLHFAVVNNRIEIVELLLDKGADLNAKVNELTALEIAQKEGFTEIETLLLQKKTQLMQTSPESKVADKTPSTSEAKPPDEAESPTRAHFTRSSSPSLFPQSNTANTEILNNAIKNDAQFNDQHLSIKKTK